VITVIDYESNEEVLFFRSSEIDTIELAHLVHDIVMLYRPSLVAPERNGLGLVVIKELEALQTPGLYREVPILTKLGEVEKLGKVGWVTTSVNKAMMIQELEEAIRKGWHRVASQEFLNEARVYQSMGGGKYSAPYGFHDDTIMSRAIALQLRKHMNQISVDGPLVVKRGPRVKSRRKRV